MQTMLLCGEVPGCYEVEFPILNAEDTSLVEYVNRTNGVDEIC